MGIEDRGKITVYIGRPGTYFVFNGQCVRKQSVCETRDGPIVHMTLADGTKVTTPYMLPSTPDYDFYRV